MFPFFGIFIVSGMSDGMNLNPQWSLARARHVERPGMTGMTAPGVVLCCLPVLALAALK